jgi:RimJ/RimL family protein N-acetyltransferase
MTGASTGTYGDIDERIAAAYDGSIWVGDKIRLRGYELADAEFESGFEDSADQRAGWRVFPPRSTVAQRGWTEEAASAKPEGDAVRFRLAIARREDDQLVGNIVTHTVDTVCGTFMFGIGLTPEAKGNGYAAEAVLLVMRYMFDERRFQKCESACYAYNTPSLALHRKLGFVEEGRVRRHAFAGGEFHDVVLYGMTIEEYRERYPAMRSRLLA